MMDRSQESLPQKELAFEYSVRRGVLNHPYFGQILGIEIKPPIGAANTYKFKESCQEKGIGVGAAYRSEGSAGTFLQLDTDIQTLGDGNHCEYPGTQAVNALVEMIAVTEPNSIVTVDDSAVYTARESLFGEDAIEL